MQICAFDGILLMSNQFQVLNQYLNGLMDGLTAKVFRYICIV